MRPTVYLNLPNVKPEWDARDRGLAEGLGYMERTMLPHGISAEVAFDPSSDGWLEAVPVVDHAQAAIERAQRAEKEPEPGTRYRVIDTRTTPSPKG